MTESNIKNLIDELDLKWEYILYWLTPRVNNKPKKEVKGVSQQITNIDILKKKYAWLVPKNTEYYVACKINLKGEPMIVIDIDEDVELDQVFKTYPCLKDTYYVKGNTIGYHFYAYSEEYETMNFTKTDCMMKYKGDFIGDNIWERIDKPLMNNDIQEIDQDQIVAIYPLFPFTEVVSAPTTSTSLNF